MYVIKTIYFKVKAEVKPSSALKRDRLNLPAPVSRNY